MTEMALWILGGIAALITYVVLQIVGEVVVGTILYAIYWPFKPFFDWLIFDRRFWREGTFWRDLHPVARVFLAILGFVAAMGLFFGFFQYLEFRT
ncbi:MAG: hypothetical protein V4633_21350 [Pseudomonadota bacterium]